MRFRFAAGTKMLALAMTAGVATAAVLAQTQRFQPFYAVRTVETQDKFGKAQSTFYTLEERDASGRTLTARLDSPAYGGKLTQATILDPVKTRRIEINYVARTATITQFPASAAVKLLPSTKPFAADDPNRSDLGDKTLDGLDVHGYTWTVTDPNPLAEQEAAAAGTAAARPPAPPTTTFSPLAYPVTYESWWSPVLQVFLLTKARDGNGNQQIIRYDQVKATQPTATDFAIPASFHVRTIEAGTH